MGALRFSTYHFIIVRWVLHAVSPWGHPQLTVRVESDENLEFLVQFLDVGRHGSCLRLREWFWSSIGILAGVLGGSNG